MVRKNRQERFLSSASFADDPKGEGMDSPSNPSSKKVLIFSPTKFWWGFFIGSSIVQRIDCNNNNT